MPSSSRILRLTPLPCLVLALGCEEPRNVEVPGAAPTPVQASAPAPVPAPAPAVVQPREVLGKRTQDVRPMAPELKAGAQVAPLKVTARDPITLSGNVYVVAVGQTAITNVKHAIDLYQAEHGEYPRTYEEFRDEILKPGKPDGIALPRLPYYQEYSYDANEHKLVVLEYPDRKAALQKQEDAKLGR